METSEAFIDANSYGRASYDWSFYSTDGGATPAFVEIDVEWSACDSLETIYYWLQDSYADDDDDDFSVPAYDTLAFEAGDIDPNDYDFVAMFVPWCECVSCSYEWYGVGWLGLPGFLIHVRAVDYDNAISHELGHNLGLGHAGAYSSSAGAFSSYQDDASMGFDRQRESDFTAVARFHQHHVAIHRTAAPMRAHRTQASSLPRCHGREHERSP